MVKNMTNGQAGKIVATLIVLSVAAIASGLWNHEGRLVATETKQGFILQGVERINLKLDKLIGE